MPLPCPYIQSNAFAFAETGRVRPVCAHCHPIEAILAKIKLHLANAPEL